MFGYGQWSHRAYVKRTALYARSFTLLLISNSIGSSFAVWI